MGVLLYAQSVTRSYTEIATTYPVKNPTDNMTIVRRIDIQLSLLVSHHPMTRKDRPCLCVQRCRSQPCIDRRVLDVRMTQPILHKRQISASIKQVCCNRMLQTMKLALLLWNSRSLSILLHELPEHEPANRYIAIRHKEIWRFIRTCSQIRADHLQHIRLHGVHSGD